MPAIAGQQLIEQLEWRCAVKKFDPARRIPEADWDALERALVLTPSAFGLQPWKFIVVTYPAVKVKLRPVSWNQSQVEDCSHLLVLAMRKGLGKPEIDHYVERIAEVRAVPVESLDGYRAFMVGALAEGPRAAFVWPDPNFLDHVKS